MEHPFVTNTELSEQKIQTITGGNTYLQYNLSTKAPGSAPVVKPKIGSTMAIGEEGGSFGDWF